MPRYATLSHCWGSSKPACMTTTKTLARNMAGIPWCTLSKTFQDTIDLLRKLGIDYVWIDSMCIVQDDLEDWTAEAVKMGSIYANSMLTIAATNSKDGNGGLYCTPSHDFRLVKLTGSLPDGQPVLVNAMRQIIHFGVAKSFTERNVMIKEEDPDRMSEILRQLEEEDAIPDHPLLWRGWVLQEQLLSRRILHFTRRELVWECRTRTRCMRWTESDRRHPHTQRFKNENAAGPQRRRSPRGTLARHRQSIQPVRLDQAR